VNEVSPRTSRAICSSRNKLSARVALHRQGFEKLLTAIFQASSYSFLPHGSGPEGMKETDARNRDSSKSTICRLEWIAMAMDAARRYKESEHAPQDADARSERNVDEEH
jgi:hypothetical protein